MLAHDGCDCPEAQLLRAVVDELERGPAGQAIELLAARMAVEHIRQLSYALSEAGNWAGPRPMRSEYTDDDVPDWARASNAKLAATRRNTRSATDATTHSVCPPRTRA